MIKFIKFFRRGKERTLLKQNLHLEKMILPLTDFWFYISYKIKVKHFCMAYGSGFLVESKALPLANLYRGDLLKDFGQFTEFLWNLRPRLRPGCQSPELCSIWCDVRRHRGCTYSRHCPRSYRRPTVAALEPPPWPASNLCTVYASSCHWLPGSGGPGGEFLGQISAPQL